MDCVTNHQLMGVKFEARNEEIIQELYSKYLCRWITDEPVLKSHLSLTSNVLQAKALKNLILNEGESGKSDVR